MRSTWTTFQVSGQSDIHNETLSQMKKFSFIFIFKDASYAPWPILEIPVLRDLKLKDHGFKTSLSYLLDFFLKESEKLELRL